MGVLSQHPFRYILKGHYQFIPNADNFICLGVINIQLKHDLLWDNCLLSLARVCQDSLYLTCIFITDMCTICLGALKDDELKFIIYLSETFSPMLDMFRTSWNVRTCRNIEMLLVTQPYTHQIQHDTT